MGLIGLNFLKVPLALAFALDHSIISLLQQVLIISAGGLCALSNKKGPSINSALAFFLIYHSLMYISQISIYLFSPVGFGDYVSATFSFLRIVALASLYVIFSTTVQRRSALRISYTIAAYLTFTTIISFLQTPESPYFMELNAALNDLTSANHLGYFRSTGGIGGTVVDYSVYLVITGIFIYLYARHSRPPFIWLGAMVLGLFFCFSRISFLSIGLLFLAWWFQLGGRYRQAATFLAALLLVLGFGILADTSAWVAGLASEAAGNSDQRRIEGWFALLSNLHGVAVLVGREVGGNTGFYLGDDGKISGDGFLLSHVYDYGLVGLFSIMWLTYSFIRRKFPIFYDVLVVSIVLLIATFVNSGIEKTFNYAYLFIVISVGSGLVSSSSIASRSLSWQRQNALLSTGRTPSPDRR